MIEILKDRWYIEDQIRPSVGRKVNLVVDIYTDESILKIPLIKEVDEKLLDLKIYGVNLGRELAFIEKHDHVIIDLGDLKNWTSLKNSQGLTKVRLDLKFTVVDPDFEISNMDLGYESSFEIYGYKLEKGAITVPLGLKLGNNGELEVLVLKKYGKKEEKIRINPKADYVDVNNKRKRYHFSLSREDQKIFESEECELTLEISYKTVNDKKFFVIPLISFALLILAISRFYGMFYGTIKFDIRYFAASVAFLGLILTFIKDGYELPFRKFIFVSVLILIIDMSLELIFLTHG